MQDPVAVLLPANALHVLAAGAWIGGLAVLVAALPAATRRLEPPERTRVLSATLGRFSGLALVAVALLLAGGIAQSLLELGAVNDLWDTRLRPRDRDQGRARRSCCSGSARSTAGAPCRGCGRAAARARRPAARACCCGGRCAPRSALGVAALAVTGALAGYPPATAPSAGPVLRLAPTSAPPAPS